ncbi:MAG: aldo/keto reductase, partial [Thiomonas sp.]
SKFFWGIDAGTADKPRINGRNTLNRKYLLQAVDGSLRRLRLEFIDLIFCHRPDPNTPIEETVWAMHDIIAQGKALYWGTSEWSAEQIRTAWDIADRHHLHKPVMEQPQYHLFHRRRVEQEYARLYEDIGLGLTTWSPLASGLLTGKYRQGVPAGSRGAMPNVSFLRDGLLDARKNAAVGEFEAIARQLGCSTAQLALAWVAHNPQVSTVILGASRLAQLQENLGALDVLPRLTPEVLAQMDAISAPLAE